MGFWGGKFDLIFQRIIEIWSNLPFLYVIIIISSIMVPNFLMLIVIMAFFGWIGITWTMRTITYKEKAREYVLAAKRWARPTSNYIQAYHTQHHCHHRHFRALCSFRGDCGTHLSGLSGVRSSAANAQLGRDASAGMGQPGCVVDRRFGLFGDDYYLMAVTFIGEAIREASTQNAYNL